jgi:hypothetical protein
MKKRSINRNEKIVGKNVGKEVIYYFGKGSYSEKQFSKM